MTTTTTNRAARRMAGRTIQANARTAPRRSAGTTGTGRVFAISGESMRFGDVAAAEGGAGSRTFELGVYSGGALDLDFWAHPVVLDVAGVRASAKHRPVLRDHDRGRIVGHTTSIDIDASGSRITAKGVVSGTGQDAQEIVATSRNEFPWQSSIGARALSVEFVKRGASAQANGRTWEGPVYIVRASEVKEISIVALGADDTSWSRIAAQQAGEQDDPPEVVAGDAGAGDENRDAIADMRSQAAAERRRIAAIDQVADGHPEIAAQAIEGGWTVERAELAVLRAQRRNVPPMAGRGGGTVQVSATALEASLLAAHGVSAAALQSQFDARTLEAAASPELRDLSLQGLFYRVIAAAGGWAQAGRFNDDTIIAAFRADRQLIQANAGGFSTLSLSGILANVAHKALLASFLAVPSVVSEICREANNSDFKSHTRYRLTGQGVLEEVGPTGELQHAGLTEQAFTNAVKTFGKMLALTRQMIINDDLGAFLELPQILGRMAALSREEAVFKLLLANAGSFFGVGNANYIEGADTDLSIGGLTLGEQKFLDQVDQDGKPILLTPSVLLVPTTLKVVAEQLYKQTAVNETTTASKPKPADNPHAGKFKPVSTPFLNSQGIAGGSAKAWYLFADPRSGTAAVEVAYLRGMRQPTIQTAETDFNTLGVQMRAFWDFGAALQDPRGAVKSKGEA